MGFDELLIDAERALFKGWDFSLFGDRFTEQPTSWDYRSLIKAHLDDADRVLDMGTGGGEFLSSLFPLSAKVSATEGYAPNVPVARERLASLGVDVSQTHTEDNEDLPFPDGEFDLILNRHESFDAPELARVLAPSGTFITQQVGGTDLAEINDQLGAPPPVHIAWDLATAMARMTAEGFTVIDAREEHCEGAFADIGAVVLFLRIAPWHIDGFTVPKYRDRLRQLHERIEAEGSFPVRHHRFLLTCRAPD
ncbi:methyltransferase family protein [Stackebrandtia endophytica]|uniref:Methyltransferase family protein n=1 Tax=Stackebrandtia endophytica TaxID=1496996 RepID=A0A543ARL8_9ACTN|nr:class I SAM-dependent methyltransferase [Stackebrandtia endophytica]TQL75227.1 methyltransferase family protein [Stackebrandtia endophytica]